MFWVAPFCTISRWPSCKVDWAVWNCTWCFLLFLMLLGMFVPLREVKGHSNSSHVRVGDMLLPCEPVYFKLKNDRDWGSSNIFSCSSKINEGDMSWEDKKGVYMRTEMCLKPIYSEFNRTKRTVYISLTENSCQFEGAPVCFQVQLFYIVHSSDQVHQN